MVRRHLAPIAIVSFALAVTPARAVVTNDTHQCGGTSPVTATCSTSGTVSARPINVLVQPTIGYTGRIVATMTTSSGFYTLDCSLRVSPVFSTCTPTVGGFFIAGQLYTLTGDASGAGIWSVAVQN